MFQDFKLSVDVDILAFLANLSKNLGKILFKFLVALIGGKWH